METLSPNPQCMRTSIPIWVDGLNGPQSGAGFIEAISLSEPGLLAELINLFLSCHHATSNISQACRV